MPRYRVTSPDGATYEVNAPEGATEADAIAYVQKQGAAPSPAQQPQAEDPGVMMAGVIGAGRVVDQAIKGVKQFGHKITGNTEALDRMAHEEAENKRIYAGLEQQHPMATSVGEMVPLMAALPAAGTMTGAAAISALPGLVSYGTTGEKMISGGLGAVGGAAGAGLGKLAGRVLQPMRGAPDAAMSEATEAAARIGYRPTVGQESGSRALQMLEQQAAKNPISAGSAQRYNQANQTAINSAAARSMGESAEQITEDLFASARSRIGAEFDRLSADKVVPLGKEFSGRIQALKQRVEAAGPFKNTQAVDTLENAALVARSGKVTGEAYQAIRSELTDMSRVATRAGNDKLSGHIKGVRKAFDDAAERVLSPEDVAAWKTARTQYAVMKALEKRGAVKAGDVDPAIIRNQLQSSDKGAYARGNMHGELADIARIGNAFRPLPDSGTAGNAVAQALLMGGAGLMGPGHLAAAAAGPFAASKILFGKGGQNYLRNGVVKVDDELEKRLMQGGYGLLGMPLVAAGQ